MNTQELLLFFRWCTIINGALLLLFSLSFLFFQNTTYSFQVKFIEMDRKTWNSLMFAFLGLFKLFFILFNLTPFIALSIL